MATTARPIRVLLIADDPAQREALSAALRAPGLALAAAVGSADAAVRACEELQPDVALVDTAMAGGGGFAAVQDIMAFHPTPILVLTDAVGGPSAFDALALGALDVIGRPGPGGAGSFAGELARRLRLLAGVRVITHVRGRRSRRVASPEPQGGPPVVGIAASLGGPRALAVLLKGLPRDLPAPVCVVQHISDGFSTGLASWLSSESGLEVREAVDGEKLQSGAVLVAPSGAHLTIGDRDQVVLDTGPAVEGFRPSATALFRSLAHRYGRRVVAAVLTGMGRDGADGLVAVRAAGGRTLAQDEATSVVYGMPRAAVEAGAVERVLAIEDMAASVVELVREIACGRGAP